MAHATCSHASGHGAQACHQRWQRSGLEVTQPKLSICSISTSIQRSTFCNHNSLLPTRLLTTKKRRTFALWNGVIPETKAVWLHPAATDLILTSCKLYTNFGRLTESLELWPSCPELPRPQVKVTLPPKVTRRRLCVLHQPTFMNIQASYRADEDTEHSDRMRSPTRHFPHTCVLECRDTLWQQ